MARGKNLCRPGRALAISSGTSEHQGQHRDRIVTRRLYRRTGGVGRIHHAIRYRARFVRLRRKFARRRAGQRLAAWTEGCRRRSRRQCRADHDALARSGHRACDTCRRRRDFGPGGAIVVRPGDRNHPWRGDRADRLPRHAAGSSHRAAASGEPPGQPSSRPSYRSSFFSSACRSP